jgi:hypothetical protein
MDLAADEVDGIYEGLGRDGGFLRAECREMSGFVAKCQGCGGCSKQTQRAARAFNILARSMYFE